MAQPQQSKQSTMHCHNNMLVASGLPAAAPTQTSHPTSTGLGLYPDGLAAAM